MQRSLFNPSDLRRLEALGDQTCVLPGFALPYVDHLLVALDAIEAISPFRHMVTPGGFQMSVALTNCGVLGWTADRSGYRYTKLDPLTGAPWPAMPSLFALLAREAAAAAAFGGFEPDACLVNRYSVGSRLSLHQDKNERDLGPPVVSVSLGLPAVFLFGGTSRKVKPQRVLLEHGDVVVWGGVDRMRYHGVLAIREGLHPVLGNQRINLTFRKAG